LNPGFEPQNSGFCWSLGLCGPWHTPKLAQIHNPWATNPRTWGKSKMINLMDKNNQVLEMYD
jgi:hypothetical protein